MLFWITRLAGSGVVVWEVVMKSWPEPHSEHFSKVTPSKVTPLTLLSMRTCSRWNGVLPQRVSSRVLVADRDVAQRDVADLRVGLERLFRMGSDLFVRWPWASREVEFS